MKQVITALVLTVLTATAFAQDTFIKGSGKLVTKTYSYTDFTSIELADLNGVVEVEGGKPYSINIDIDDNLAPLLEVKVSGGKLYIKLGGKEERWRMYVDASNLKIKISLPVVTGLSHNGNSDLRINGVQGKSFKLENAGNGDALLDGSVEELNIDNDGNGNIVAAKLAVNKANIYNKGNGDVIVNVAASLKANTDGNGDVLNLGKAGFEAGSAATGNGQLKKQK